MCIETSDWVMERKGSVWVGLILHLCANFSFVAWKEREKLEDDGRTYKTKYRVEWTYFMTLEINVRYILATFVFIRKKR